MTKFYDKSKRLLVINGFWEPITWFYVSYLSSLQEPRPYNGDNMSLSNVNTQRGTDYLSREILSEGSLRKSLQTSANISLVILLSALRQVHSHFQSEFSSVRSSVSYFNLQ